MNVRILIADDEESILDLLERFMTKLGYQADLATDVGGALELMRQHEYDIILTDKNMPDIDGSMEGGMTLVRFARENMPSTQVIMITGYATVETAVEAMKLGAFDYILKPIPLNDLKEKIERILEYKKFINADHTLGLYRTLYSQVLSHLENREDLPDDKIQEILKTLGAKIDQVFGLQKEYETIIQAQAEAMETIEAMTDLLGEAFPKGSPYLDLVARIRSEAQKRI